MVVARGCTQGCALVALVGAGPGAPGLITVRGRELLEHADVVVHDRLIAPELLDRAVRARRIDVGKRQGAHPVPQARINKILVDEARAAGAGGLVVRLKGGDPYVFGRGGEEASYLAAHGVPFEVVPAPTSAIAALAYAGIPVTDRRHAASLHIITGHRQQGGALGIDFRALVRAGGTLVFLMGVATMAELATGLVEAGMAPTTPAAVVERGTTPQQRRIDGTVATIAARAGAMQVTSPAILVVGEVCGLAPALDWYDRLPLRGRSVLVTRPRDRAAELCARLAALGAHVEQVPCIETVPIEPERFDELIERMGTYSWLVLTSTFGVRCLFDAIAASRRDVRCLGSVRVAAIGSATAAELARHGIKADLVPQTYDGRHLGQELAALIQGERAAADEAPDSLGRRPCTPAPRTPALRPVLIFRAAESLPDICEELAAAGIPYEDVAAYHTMLAPEEPPAAMTARLAPGGGGYDYVTFTSASTVRGFARAFPHADPAAFTAVCLGDSTRRAAEELGFTCIESAEAAIDSLVARMLGEMRTEEFSPHVPSAGGVGNVGGRCGGAM